MEKYRDKDGHLNLVARQEIQRLLEKGIRISKIADSIDFCNVSIYKEVKKNTLDGPYNALMAQENAEYSTGKRHGNLSRLRISRKLGVAPPPALQQEGQKETRIQKIEEEIESLKTFIKTISDILEEVYNRKP